MNMRHESTTRPRGFWSRTRVRPLLGGRMGRVVRALRQKRPQEAMRSVPAFTRFVSVLMVAVFFVTGDPLHGATISWTQGATDFNAAASWVGGVVPTVSDTADFGATLTSAQSVSLSANSSVLGITMASPNAVTLNAASAKTLTLGSGGIQKTAGTGA